MNKLSDLDQPMISYRSDLAHAYYFVQVIICIIHSLGCEHTIDKTDTNLKWELARSDKQREE